MLVSDVIMNGAEWFETYDIDSFPWEEESYIHGDRSCIFQ